MLAHNVAWQGSALRALSLARPLARRGHDVVVVASRLEPGARTVSDDVDGVRLLQLPVPRAGEVRNGGLSPIDLARPAAPDAHARTPTSSTRSSRDPLRRSPRSRCVIAAAPGTSRTGRPLGRRGNGRDLAAARACHARAARRRAPVVDARERRCGHGDELRPRRAGARARCAGRSRPPPHDRRERGHLPSR